MQVAIMFASVANGGYLVKPHLLKDNEDLTDWREPIGLRESTISILQEGLREVITNGTARAMNVPDLPPIAGKTGTAEAPPYKSHAWFGAYAPMDKPEIVVVTFGEHSGGGGSSVAAPMALEVIKAYFGADTQVAESTER